MAEPPEQRRPTLRDFLRVVFKHKAKIVCVLSATLIVVSVALYFWPKSYQISSKILVKFGREIASTSPTVISPGQVIISRQKEDILSEIEIIRNRFVLERTVKALEEKLLAETPDVVPDGLVPKLKSYVKEAIFGLQSVVTSLLVKLDLIQELSPFDKVVNAIQKNLTVEEVLSANVIEVSLYWRDPEIGTEIVRTLVDLYVEHHLEVHSTPGAIEFFENQTKLLGDELKRWEDELAAFKEKWSISSFEEQKRSLLQQITRLESLLNDTESAVTEYKERRDKLKEQPYLLWESVRFGESIQRNPVADSTKNRLLELKLREKAALNKYAEDSAPVEDIRKEIREVESALDSLWREEIEAAEAHLATLEAKREFQNRSLQGYRDELNQLSARENEFRRLTRRVDITEESYRTFVKKMEEARISSVMDNQKIANVSVIDPALPPARPAKPQKLLVLVIAGIVGTFVALGLAFLVEYLDESMSSEDDVKSRLDLPLLASIPWSPGAREKFPRALEAPFFSQAIKWLQHEVNLGDLASPRSSLIVSGVNRQDGASTTAAYLAVAVAADGASRVLLVDADLRAPSVHKTFNVRRENGFSDLISGDVPLEDATRETSFENLTVIPSGSTPDSVSSFFSQARRIEAVIAELKKQYDWVVLDGAPVGPYPDSTVLAAHLDGVLLVAEADRTRWQAAQKGKEKLAGSKSELLGLVLNKKKYFIPSSIYRRT